MNEAHAKPSPSVDRLALIGLTIAGMAVCTAGIGKVAASGQWLTFPAIAGSLLGITILGIVGARLLGRTLPLVTSDRAAFVAIVGLALGKVAIAAVIPM